MEDSRIVELYWARDERAIAESDVKYGRLLRSVSYTCLGNREDAEECTNDTYLEAWAQCRRQDQRISARFFPKSQDGSPLTASGMTTRESAAGCSP